MAGKGDRDKVGKGGSRVTSEGVSKERGSSKAEGGRNRGVSRERGERIAKEQGSSKTERERIGRERAERATGERRGREQATRHDRPDGKTDRSARESGQPSGRGLHSPESRQAASSRGPERSVPARQEKMASTSTKRETAAPKADDGLRVAERRKEVEKLAEKLGKTGDASKQDLAQAIGERQGATLEMSIHETKGTGIRETHVEFSDPFTGDHVVVDRVDKLRTGESFLKTSSRDGSTGRTITSGHYTDRHGRTLEFQSRSNGKAQRFDSAALGRFNPDLKIIEVHSPGDDFNVPPEQSGRSAPRPEKAPQARTNDPVIKKVSAERAAEGPSSQPERQPLPKRERQPRERREIDSHGVNLVKEHEGLRKKSYRDPVGLWTIGYGHLIKPGENLAELTDKEAEALLRQDLAVASTAINDLVKVPLTIGQTNALTSFVFNLGKGRLKRSTLLINPPVA